DPMEYGALWERRLLSGDETFFARARAVPLTPVHLGLDYARPRLFDEAIELFGLAPTDPMAAYFTGWCHTLRGDDEAARAAFAAAARRPPDYCFPNRLESVPALEAAMRLNPQDARAPYYLGTFLYAHRRYDAAIDCWERAR